MDEIIIPLTLRFKFIGRVSMFNLLDLKLESRGTTVLSTTEVLYYNGESL